MSEKNIRDLLHVNDVGGGPREVRPFFDLTIFLDSDSKKKNEPLANLYLQYLAYCKNEKLDPLDLATWQVKSFGPDPVA